MKKNLLIVLLLLTAVVLFSIPNHRFFIEGKQYFEQGEYKKAEIAFKAAMESETVIPEYHYWLGKTYIAMQNYDLAYQHIQTYAEKNLGADTENVNKVLGILDRQMDLARTGSNVYSLGKLSENINGDYSDFGPILNPQGNKMYFTSSREVDGTKDNIWMSVRKYGGWTDPVMITELSSRNNEALGSVSPDETEAFLFGNFLSKSKKGDIYMSRKKNDEWEKPALLAGVNTKYIEIQPYVFEDIMFFASNREDTYGALDLYVSERVNGNWSEPINLGDVINTDMNEQTPFLDWDGKTLFFASDGHAGLGGLDLFKATKTGESWTEWTQPENLGLVVNSVRNDRFFYNCRDKNIAYISSDRFDGKGQEDIYVLHHMDAPEEEVMAVAEVEPMLENMEVDEALVIPNIYFEFDSATLKQESNEALDFLVEQLLAFPEIVIEISGHTDNVGNEEYNMNLSADRAASVVTYLSDKGVAEANLVSKGYGETSPIDNNETPEGRAINRRVEMKILEAMENDPLEQME